MNPSLRLKKVREYLGLTQQQLADVLGFEWHKIKNIETGKHKLTPEIAEKIEQIYSISGWWLLAGKGEMLLNEREEPQKQSEQTKEREVPKRTIINARDILEYHISERELEILQAYRSLPKQRQELFYYKAKAEEIEHGNQAKPQDVKSA